MFVNRIYELENLNREYDAAGSSFTVIYGRRRIGKTALIREFIRNKPTLYFYATESTISEQLSQFTIRLATAFNKPSLEDTKFTSFEKAFQFLAESLGDEKIVVAIDEYQNLVKADPAFSSVLQKVWDLQLKEKNIHLVLCGSIISMMHSETLDYSSPLYGRRTSSIHLKSMPFETIHKFINVNKEELMKVYASFGTVPRYLELYKARKSFLENIKDNVLSQGSYLYNEIKFLIKEEIASPNTYFQILNIISGGETKIGKIGAKMGVHASHLTRYLLRLGELDILEKDVPVTEKETTKSKLGRYRIKDKFIAFWFFYVYRNFSQLEIRNIDPVLKQINESFNQKFVSFAFEDYVKELLLHHPQKYLGFIPEKIGRWWNNKEEIDQVAFNDEHVAFIECKWQNQQVGYEVYQDMKRKAETLEFQQQYQYIIFAKKGFKTSLKESDCRLYSYLKSGT